MRRFVRFLLALRVPSSSCVGCSYWCLAGSVAAAQSLCQNSVGETITRRVPKLVRKTSSRNEPHNKRESPYAHALSSALLLQLMRCFVYYIGVDFQHHVTRHLSVRRAHPAVCSSLCTSIFFRTNHPLAGPSGPYPLHPCPNIVKERKEGRG